MIGEILRNAGYMGLGIYSFGFSLILATSKVQTLNGYVTFQWDSFFPVEVVFFAGFGTILLLFGGHGLWKALKRYNPFAPL